MKNAHATGVSKEVARRYRLPIRQIMAEVQTTSVSVEAKNIAWLTAERT